MVEHPTKPFVCGCCGYKAVDLDDLLNHEPTAAFKKLVRAADKEGED